MNVPSNANSNEPIMTEGEKELLTYLWYLI